MIEVVQTQWPNRVKEKDLTPYCQIPHQFSIENDWGPMIDPKMQKWHLHIMAHMDILASYARENYIKLTIGTAGPYHTAPIGRRFIVIVIDFISKSAEVLQAN